MIYIEESARLMAEKENKKAYKWVNKENGCDTWHCSKCGSYAEIDAKGDWIKSKHCSRCGAEMENADDR